MKTLPLPQILFSSLMLGASLSFVPNNANAYPTQCSINVTNNTNQTIYQLYILPSSAEDSHPGWKINKLNKPLGVSESTIVTIKSTPDVNYWNAFGILRDGRRYIMHDGHPFENTRHGGGLIFGMNIRSTECDPSDIAWRNYETWEFRGFLSF